MSQNGMRLKFQVLKWIVGAFWPVWIFIIGGGIFFEQSIMASIKSTQEPIIVYSIMGATLGALLLLIYASYAYIFEAYLLSKIEAAFISDGFINLNSKCQRSRWYQVYAMVNRDAPITAIKSILEIEIDKSRASFNLLTQFPAYIAGALVGMGLVGTFIGLLSTLRDLAAVFALMADIGTVGDPMQMFGQMILKLQEPIKGMGTAFVASLYGLLGSLIVGLVVLSVRGIGDTVSLDIEGFVERSLVNKSMGDDGDRERYCNQAAGLNSEIEASIENLHLLNESIMALNIHIERYERAFIALSALMLKQSKMRFKNSQLLFYPLILATLLFALLWVFSPSPASIKSVFETPVSSSMNSAEVKSNPKHINNPAHYRKVLKGESFSSIADLCNVDTKELIGLNPGYIKRSNHLMAGSVINVPNFNCSSSN